MRYFFPTICLVLGLLLCQSAVQAQPKHGFTYRYTLYNFLTPLADSPEFFDIWEQSAGDGAELAYQRRLFPGAAVVIPVKFGVTNVVSPTDVRLKSRHFLGSLDALFQYQFFKYGNLINPYLHAGVGGTYDFDNDGDEFDFNVPVGIGLNLRIIEGIYATAQTQYRYSPNDKTYWQHGVGVTAFIGRTAPKDTDKDGIPDLTDQCPTIPGGAATQGCPDRDADGIADANDKCPDVAGVAALMGCPDADADGITDADDACPTEKGLAAFKGCPDTDADGITDADDACPREAGPTATKGCPDRDGDGIADRDDACADDKGPLSTRGCPDRDADGVADREDACPDKRGDAMHKGCPDTDGDGVYDNDDRCVDQRGTIANRGCPEMKKEDRAKIELAVKAVQYETGKAVLLPQSKRILDDVAEVLLRYPYYSLNIGGHTDNVGSDAYNQTLSENRAHSVSDYLASKGVPASRMTHNGYGESKPIADNKTAAGRAANRRTEFELIIK